jgi:acyl dehydratase
VTTQIGDAIAGREILVQPESMRFWAEVLRDPNPIHLDPEAVRAKGLGSRVINQGPANVALVINTLLEAFPESRIEQLRVRFLDNVFGGETVRVLGVVTGVEGQPGNCRIRCEVALQAGDRKAVGAEAVLANSGATDDVPVPEGK